MVRRGGRGDKLINNTGSLSISIAYCLISSLINQANQRIRFQTSHSYHTYTPSLLSSHLLFLKEHTKCQCKSLICILIPHCPLIHSAVHSYRTLIPSHPPHPPPLFLSHNPTAPPRSLALLHRTTSLLHSPRSRFRRWPPRHRRFLLRLCRSRRRGGLWSRFLRRIRSRR